MNQVQAQPNVQITAHGQKILGEVDLLPGENILYAIQGDGFFLGANPLAKAAALMRASIAKITGGHIRVFVFVTNLRVLLLQSEQVLCGLQRIRAISAIALGSIAEVGSGKETQWCCIHTRVAHLESKTQRYTLVLKKTSDAVLRQFVTSMSSIVVTNVHSRMAT